MRPKKKPEDTRSRLPRIIRRTYERFLRIRGEPREIALGFSLGLFIGMTPSMGLQTPIALFSAAILKWNKISSAIGVWITNPLTAPFIYSLTYLVGARLLGLRKDFNPTDELSISRISEILHKAPGILWALLLGGIIVGLPVAVAGYLISFSVLKKYKEDVKRRLAMQKEKLAMKRKRVSQKVRKRFKRGKKRRQ